MAITRLGGANAISGTIPAANVATLTSSNLPTGSVIQEVHTTSNPASGSTTSTSYIDTGLSLAITPTQIGTKILAIANIYIAHSPGAAHRRIDFRLIVNADSSDTSLSTQGYVGNDGTSISFGEDCYTLSDTYTTLSTSVHTFKVQVRKANGTANETTTINYCGYAGNWDDHIQLIEFKG